MVPTMGMDHSFSVIFENEIIINDDTENLEYSLDMNINNWYHNPHTINLAKFREATNGMH